MAWKKGPLPKDAYGWGAVVLMGEDPRRGARVADFCGDHVMIYDRGDSPTKRVEANDVQMYDNSIEAPPARL